MEESPLNPPPSVAFGLSPAAGISLLLLLGLQLKVCECFLSRSVLVTVDVLHHGPFEQPEMVHDV